MVKYQQAVALGSRDLAQFTAQNFQILLYCNLYNIAVECQNTAEARAVLVALGEYMSINGVTVAGCDCGCGQSTTNSTEPTVIYPLYNSAVYNSATELARGIIELATQAESNAGVDDTRAITPLKLKVSLDNRAATETVIGLAEIATQAESEAAASEGTITNIDHTRILTPRGWRWAWNKALTLAWAFAEKISFSKGINLVSSAFPLIDGDLTFNSNRYYGKISGNVVTIITNESAAAEGTRGVAEIATQVETNAGTNDTKIVTPLKQQKRLYDSANTATGATSVTLNTINGKAIFTDSCAEAPSWVDYVINNSLINSSSLVAVNVQSDSGSAYASLVSVHCGTGAITIAINDGFTATPGFPIVTFQILNP